MGYGTRAATLLVASMVLGGPGAAWGMGAHYQVEDAVIVDSGRCAADAWYQRLDSDHQSLNLEANCNPTGVMEFTLGASRVDTGAEWRTDLALEGKTLLRTPVVGGWGLGLHAASTWSDGLDEHETLALTVPLTVVPNDRVAVHLNAGAAYQANDRDVGTWGVAVDVGVSENLHLIGEGYGTHHGDPTWQVGLRQRLGQATIDLSYGREEHNDEEDWITFGLGWRF